MTEEPTTPPPPTGAEVIRRFVRTLPAAPGVYRMLDAHGEVMYVGKARNLKARVTNYTRPEALEVRLQRMIGATASMEFVRTETESEALLGQFAQHALAVRAFRDALDEGDLHLVAEFLLERLGAHPVAVGPAVVVLGADIDETDLQRPFLGKGKRTHRGKQQAGGAELDGGAPGKQGHWFLLV